MLAAFVVPNRFDKLVLLVCYLFLFHLLIPLSLSHYKDNTIIWIVQETNAIEPKKKAPSRGAEAVRLGLCCLALPLGGGMRLLFSWRWFRSACGVLWRNG